MATSELVEVKVNLPKDLVEFFKLLYTAREEENEVIDNPDFLSHSLLAFMLIGALWADEHSFSFDDLVGGDILEDIARLG